MEFITSFLDSDNLASILHFVGAAVAVITALNGALAAIAPLTKTTKDDTVVAKVAKYIPKARKLLNKLGVSLPVKDQDSK